VKLDVALSFVLIVSFLFSIGALPAEAGEVRGKVVNVSGGEPLRRVQVSILELKRAVVTAQDGTFKIPQVPAGKYTLRATTVGYRLLTLPITLATDAQDQEILITLVPNFRRIDVLEVKGDVFHADNQAVPSQFDLNAAELEESSTVLADDPFRSVQALPGVSPGENNDFFGQFSVLGAPFTKVSVYVDDLLVPAPFHGLPNFNEGASLSLFTSETLQSLDLMPLAFPVADADATGAALSLRTREGSRTRPTFTVSAGITDSTFIGEGTLGSNKKGSWLISARKSYLNYLVHSINGGTFTDSDFEDGSARLSYDVASHHNLSFYFLDGHTNVSDSSAITVNDLSTGGNDFTLARLGWRYTVTPHLLFDTQGAYIRQTFLTRNLAHQILSTDYYGEWVGQTRASWNWTKNQVLEAGFTGRRLRDSGYSQDFSELDPATLQPRPLLFSPADATGTRLSGFAQQVANLFSNRVHILTGIRWDRIEQVEAQPLSAQVSAAVQMTKHTQVQFGLGRYAQFDSFQELAFPCRAFRFPFAEDLYERSNHLTAAVERTFGEYTRIRIEAFDRENHPVIGGREPSHGGPCGPIVADPNPRPVEPPFFAIRDYSRGLEFVIQRRSANRLSGWVGYTLDYARQRSPETVFSPVPPFLLLGPLVTEPTTEDQRHTLNGFATYRLTPSINVSGKFLYGSGFPVPGTSSIPVGNTFVTVANQTRLGDYQRLDLRLDKSWAYTRWKVTLYSEVLNVTNHNNPRFIFTSFRANGQVFGVTEKGFPVLPTAGLVFQF
jgi:hypothetical protein